MFEAISGNRCDPVEFNWRATVGEIDSQSEERRVVRTKSLKRKAVWTKFLDWTGGAIYHGAVLRFPAHWPYEAVVDFLVFDPADRDRGLGLMVDSGYKAGLILVRLPKESAGAYDARCICPQWLGRNWSTWIYPETPVAEVFISPGRPAPGLPIQKLRSKRSLAPATANARK